MAFSDLTGERHGADSRTRPTPDSLGTNVGGWQGPVLAEIGEGGEVRDSCPLVSGQLRVHEQHSVRVVASSSSPRRRVPSQNRVRRISSRT